MLCFCEECGARNILQDDGAAQYSCQQCGYPNTIYWPDAHEGLDAAEESTTAGNDCGDGHG